MRLLPLLLLALPLPALGGGTYAVLPEQVTDWKAVYGQVSARDEIAARSRLSGTLVDMAVSEGDSVEAGQVLARVEDEKIGYQLSAADAQIAAVEAQLANAQSELRRGQELTARGISSTQQLDALRTQVDVYTGQIAALRAGRKVTEQQALEGAVLAPVSGRVLTVPVTRGTVVMAGETVATVAGGGFYLRLSVPERFAAALAGGAPIEMDTPQGTLAGRLAKVYPLIEGGRVQADVEVPALDARFVAARVLVRLPLATRQAILVPQAAVETRAGLDFVRLEGQGERVVLPGARRGDRVEIVSGLEGGETLVLP